MNVIETPLIECLALCEILWCAVSMLYKWCEKACVECYVGLHYVFIHIHFELLNLIFKVYLLPNHLKEFCTHVAVNNAYLNTEGNGTITDNSQIRSRNMPIAYFHQSKILIRECPAEISFYERQRVFMQIYGLCFHINCLRFVLPNQVSVSSAGVLYNHNCILRGALQEHANAFMNTRWFSKIVIRQNVIIIWCDDYMKAQWNVGDLFMREL